MTITNHDQHQGEAQRGWATLKCTKISVMVGEVNGDQAAKPGIAHDQGRATRRGGARVVARARPTPPHFRATANAFVGAFPAEENEPAVQ